MRRARVKRRGIAAPALVAIGLLAAAAALPQLTRVPVREVKIHGAFQHVARAQVKAVLAPHLAMGWVRLSASRLRGQLEALPAVASASVGREWPLNLSIEIAERRPVARWGRKAMLDEHGVVFDSSLPIDRRLPLLHGPQDSEGEVLARYREFSPRLGERSLVLDELSLGPRGGWTLTVREGPQLRLGVEAVEGRFERALLALDSLPAGEQGLTAAYVDMRYPNGFAVASQSGGARASKHGGASP